MDCMPLTSTNLARFSDPGYRVLALFAAACLALLFFDASVFADEGAEFFEKRIRPVLVEKCYSCHSATAKKVRGGLKLDSSAAIRSGGDSGVILVPGKPEESLLIDAVSYNGDAAEMPPDAKLSDRVIADFRKWVASGAVLPTEKNAIAAPSEKRELDIAKGREFWSFQPVQVQPLPAVTDREWPRNRIDYFVLQKLEEKSLRPAPSADRRTLVRRAYFDLAGLPPSYDEVEEFVGAAKSRAFGEVIDTLLASPHYGERWGRHWLDVARYAEDNPTSESTCKPPRFPHVYRDWVIRALNDDLPYDEFVRRQLAADLMDVPPAELAALGFLGLSPVYHKEPKLAADVIAVIVADEWDERLDTITRGFLGLTVACARCHDHKFDPITTEDYYALAGVMASTQLVEQPLVETDLATAAALTDTYLDVVDTEQRLSYAKAFKKTAQSEGKNGAEFDPQIAEFDTKLKRLKDTKLFDGPIANAARDAGLWLNGDDAAWTALDFKPGVPRDLPVFIRGNVSNTGAIVPRRFVEVLSPAEAKPFQQGSGRKELAECIVGDAAPLAARVIVNRVWGWHFGQPLVRTPSNFGQLGERPSHPALLDDLAARLIENKWSLKWLHREILTSATWQQASTHNAAAHAIDPDNRLLWRMNRRRLEAETWRDMVLATSGKLDETLYGPSTPLDKQDNRRRTIYGTVSRQRVADVLRLFDFPDAKAHSEQRLLTTTPLQQLYVLNSPFLQSQATAIAESLRKDDAAEMDRSQQVTALFHRVLLRDPSAAELSASLNLISADGADVPAANWTMLAHALLAGNEFLFVD